MQKTAICVTLYEEGRPYLDDFLRAVRTASQGREVILVAAVDGLRDAAIALSVLEPDIQVLRVSSPGGLSPVAMRRIMLTTGYTSGAGTLIFIDMDDVLAPDALALHAAALRDADISFGDLKIVDQGGACSGRHFFDAASIPDRLRDAVPLRARNFLGFSNTAVRAANIPADALAIPEGVVAADWWFFTSLMLGGCRAQKTSAPVASYRLHPGNILGAGVPADPAQALSQACAMECHYRAFPRNEDFVALAADTKRRIAALDRMPRGVLAERLYAMRGQPGVWFEHVGHLLANGELSSKPLPATG